MATPSLNDPNSTSIEVQRLRCALQRLDFLTTARSSIIDRLMPAASLVSYAHGDTVIAMGQFDTGFLYGIVDGKASLTQARPDGDVDVTNLTGGMVVGLVPLLANEREAEPSTSLVADTPLDVLVIDAEVLSTLVQRDALFCRHLLEYIAQEHRRLEAPLDDSVSPVRRVYRHLLSLVRRDGDRFVIATMPRHADLAEAAGVDDRDAAAAVAILLSGGAAIRDYPGLVISDIEKLRHLSC